MMIYLILIAAAIVIFIIIRKKMYHLKYDTLLCFTGTMGSGKTFLGVKMTLKLYRKQWFRVFWYNYLHPFDKMEYPLIFSNIPIKCNWMFKNRVRQLTMDHLLLQARLPARCVVFFDEIGSVFSQWVFNDKSVKENFSEFVRYFRHYTLGGYLVGTDQNSDNIVNECRRRLGQCYVLSNFTNFFHIRWSVDCRRLFMTEGIKSVETTSEDNGQTWATLSGFFPLWRQYDSYCYSCRYDSVPEVPYKKFESMKLNEILQLPQTKDYKAPMTNNQNDFLLSPKRKPKFTLFNIFLHKK